MQTIRNVMTPVADTIRPEAPLREAAIKMKAANIGALPVTDHGQLKGIITDRDIVLEGVADTDEFSILSVEDAMSSDPSFCYEDETLESAAELMEENQVRRVPILNRSHQVVGLLSIDDVARKNKKLAARVLKNVAPFQPRRLLPTLIKGTKFLGFSAVVGVAIGLIALSLNETRRASNPRSHS